MFYCKALFHTLQNISRLIFSRGKVKAIAKVFGDVTEVIKSMVRIFKANGYTVHILQGMYDLLKCVTRQHTSQELGLAGHSGSY